MNAVECAGKDEIIVGGKLGEGRGEVTVVDETAGFVDDYEGVHDPAILLVRRFFDQELGRRLYIAWFCEDLTPPMSVSSVGFPGYHGILEARKVSRKPERWKIYLCTMFLVQEKYFVLCLCAFGRTGLAFLYKIPVSICRRSASGLPTS